MFLGFCLPYVHSHIYHRQLLQFLFVFAYSYTLDFPLRNDCRRNIYSPLFSLLVISYGYYSYTKTQNHHIPNYYQQNGATQYVGIIDDEPVYKEKTIRFPVKLINAIDSNRTKVVSGKVMLTILRDSLEVVDYSYGDKIVFVNKLKDLNPPYNPKEFDYKAYLANKGIVQQALLKGEEILFLEPIMAMY